jgi:hypothetical protein
MISATFDGAEREFHVKSEYVGLFERALPCGSIYGTLKRFTDGTWTADDVIATLSFALHGPSHEVSIIWRSGLAGQRYGMAMPHVSVPINRRVSDVVMAEGHGNFSGLASEILTDVLLREQANADAD